MATENFLKRITKHIKENLSFIDHNKIVFEISEGDLVKYVSQELAKQLSGDSSKLAIMRVSPINVMNKINQKLSKLYNNGVTRETENEINQELISLYAERADEAFMAANENFNLYKNSVVEIYEDNIEKRLEFRSMPSNLYLPYSDNPIDPLIPTALIKFMGYDEEIEKDKYWIYTKDEFISISLDGEFVKKDMLENEGINPFGVLPFTYILKSRYLLIPIADNDYLRLTLLIPVLLTDMNFSSMFLSMPILYGIDIDAQNLKLSPNQLWSVKSDDINKTPTVGVLKAEPNLESMMNSAIAQLSMWLETRNIKPGTIGKVQADNFSSGVSKLISEMDTIEDRKMQAQFFRKAEIDFWRRLGVIHNKLADTGRIETRQKFVDPENMVVTVEYPEEKVIESRDAQVEREKKEFEAGFTSKRRAIKKLNPKMSEEEVDELIKEIQEETIVALPDQDIKEGIELE